MYRTRVLLLTLIASGLPMLATDGYFSMGYGTDSKGMGGVGAALPLGALSTATNPAAMAFVNPQADLGFAWFSPSRDFEVKGLPSGYPGTFGLQPGKVESGSKNFLVPSLGLNWKLSDKATFGLAVYGNGGMNTNYDESVFGAGHTGVNLSQLFIAPNVAYRFAEGQSVGASIILAHQQFEARGLGSFMGFSSDANNLTDRGKDTCTGYGVRIGYLGQFSPKFSFGLSYQTHIRMGDLKKYAGLFAEQGGFDIPSNYSLGVAFHPTETLTIALDFERINYGEVNSVGDPMLPNLQRTLLGSDNGAGFGWRNIGVYKLGVQWKATDNLTLRAGYNHCEQPVPDSEVIFNILAPGVVQDHFTIGATETLTPKSAISLSVMRAPSSSVTGWNPLEAPGAQTITLRMDQWDVEFGYSYKF